MKTNLNKLINLMEAEGVPDEVYNYVLSIEAELLKELKKDIEAREQAIEGGEQFIPCQLEGQILKAKEILGK